MEETVVEPTADRPKSGSEHHLDVPGPVSEGPSIDEDVPPVAPPRKSPSRRKRLLGKRVRKKTGGETGDGIRKLDPTTSEEEGDNDKTTERKEDQWRREDEEKRLDKERKDQKNLLKDQQEQLEKEEWAKIFQNAKTKQQELQSGESQIDTAKSAKPEQDDKPQDTSKDDKRETQNEQDKQTHTPWWKFWKKPEKPVKEDKVKVEEPAKEETTALISKQPPLQNKVIKDIEPKQDTKIAFKLFTKEARVLYSDFKKNNWKEWEIIKMQWNKCLGELIIIIMLCGLGAFTFRFTEGAFENFYKCGVKRVKRDFVEELWKTSTYLKEDEWKSKARRKLMEFEEQLGVAYDAGISSYSGHKSWTFINALLYSLTIITTIGYGHIAPATTTGKALTIVYATIGIPMFLILLADFGKLFTRGIKWVWAFVRRLYYTGSCKKVRRTGPVQEVMKGVQLVYDMAAFRRPSSTPGPDGTHDTSDKTQSLLQPQPVEQPIPHMESETMPSTPAPSNFVIDEEFNLPISLAITILVLYIFCGAVVFYMWEDWSFFDSFYFVFISMSTIGFGDLVPKNKMYMMASIVYLAFGLALTSMCINVVQEKLSDTFRQASAKIGTTIGIKMKGMGEDGGLSPNTPASVELVQVHQSIKTPTPNPAAV